MSNVGRELRRLQRWMQAVITDPEGVVAGLSSAEAQGQIALGPDDLESVVSRSRALGSVDRLEIYAGAYYARLLECLRAEFPVLTLAVGEDLFDEFAVDYLRRHPPRSYTLNRLGAEFPRYLAETRPEGESWAEMLVDLATLEWAIGEVFDGPGAEGERLLGADDLSAIPVDRRRDARLVAAPCVRTLALRHPVWAYYTALRDGRDVSLPEPAECFLALTRRDYVVRIHELSPLESAVLSAILEGESLGSAVESVALRAGPDVAALAADFGRWFHNWAVAGFFRSVELS